MKIKLFLFIFFVFGFYNTSNAISYIDSANKLAESGVIKNNSDNTDEYKVYDNITRGEMAKIVVNLSKIPLTQDCKGLYSDLKDSSDWRCKYAESGNLSGFFTLNDTFRPDDNITKIEALKMIMQARNIEKNSDNDWKVAYVKSAYEHGLIDLYFYDYNVSAVRGWIFELATREIKNTNNYSKNTTSSSNLKSISENCFKYEIKENYYSSECVKNGTCDGIWLKNISIITDYDESCGKDVVIPNTLGGFKVGKIGDRAFLGKGLLSLIISDNVIEIGDGAFRRNNLTKVVIPNSVIEVRSHAFYNNKLSEVTLPNSLKSIGWNTFAENQLTSIKIPNTVTYIGTQAFDNNNLTELTIPDLVTYIGYGAFRDNKLTKVNVGKSLNEIGQFSFVHNPSYNSSVKVKFVCNGFKINPTIPDDANVVLDNSCK